MNAAAAITTILRWVLVTLGIVQILVLIGGANATVPAGPAGAPLSIHLADGSEPAIPGIDSAADGG